MVSRIEESNRCVSQDGGNTPTAFLGAQLDCKDQTWDMGPHVFLSRRGNKVLVRGDVTHE